MATAASPKLLLFDLGGVLVEAWGAEDFHPILAQRLEEAEIRARLAGCECVRQFDRGELSPDQFAEAFALDWPLLIRPAEFIDCFRGWTKRLYPGVRELLDELRPRHRLAALSNSNELHWRRMSEDWGLEGLFERAFSSHQIGMLKPSREIFEHALAELSVEPADVAFFDDLAANVEGARLAGIRAFQVHGVEETRACLAGLGLL